MRTNLRAPVAWLLLIAAIAGQAGCGQPEQPDNAANVQNVAEDRGLDRARIPLPAPPVDRAALLTEIARAASAEAAGDDDRAAQQLLDGKPFELRVRFGCQGPSRNLRRELFGWSYERDKRTLRVRATPTISKADDVAARIGGDGFEAIEGFWLPRPWLLEPACPATAAVTAATAPAEGAAPAPGPEAAPDEDEPAESQPAVLPKFGIAQFFTATDSRTRRRSMRPYEAVKTLEPNAPIGPQGFNLVLSGRLRALPDKRVIACQANGADRPPDCIVSAAFDRVWIERADRRETVAEWGGS